MRLIIAKIGNNETISFAVSELIRLIEKMDETVVLDVRKYMAYDSNVKNAIWVGTGFVETHEKDTVFINVENSVGVISGSNECSVLIAVYRFMKELGCRFLYPGKDGEKIPKRNLNYSDLTVNVNETASYNHRAICIEGTVSYEHVVNTIDWLPKVGMSGYFTQFLTPTVFFKSYYRKFFNDETDPHYGNELTDADVDAIMEKVKEEVVKRSLRYHTGGHVWIGKALGLNSSGWEAFNGEISEETRSLLALMDGKRDFYQGAVSCTNLCYSNPLARKKLADVLVEYCEQHQEVACIHFWLADHPNNHCECEECAKKIPTDFYVMLLNEIDEKLTAKNLKTRIPCCIYNETMFAPITEKINNPDRFILDFAPISRSYSHSYEDVDLEKEVELVTYERNKISPERAIEANVARLNEWKKQGINDSYAFEYHLMWDHYFDPGYYDVAKMLHKDVKNLVRLGLNGMISCQVLRCAFPTGLPQYAMAHALWNRDGNFADVENEYFTAAFGEDAMVVRDYLSSLSKLFDPELLRGEKSFDAETVIKQYNRAKALVDEFKDTYISKMKSTSKDWEFLFYHAEMVKYYADAYIGRFSKNEEDCKAQFEKLKEYVNNTLAFTDSVLDDGFLNGTVYNNLFGWRRRF